MGNRVVEEEGRVRAWASDGAQGEEPVLCFLEAPVLFEPCPLFEYCLVEAVLARGINLVLDARQKKTSLLAGERLQSALELTYEQVPDNWRANRGFPHILVRLLSNLLKAPSAESPLRVLVVYGREERWRMTLVAEHCRLEFGTLRVEWIVNNGDSEGEFCKPALCPLFADLRRLARPLGPVRLVLARSPGAL